METFSVLWRISVLRRYFLYCGDNFCTAEIILHCGDNFCRLAFFVVSPARRWRHKSNRTRPHVFVLPRGYIPVSWRFHGRFRRLWAGSVRPKQTWGHQFSGVTQAEVLKLRRARGKATNISKPGACLTFAIALGFGPRGGPHASIIKELFTCFFQLVQWYVATGEKGALGLRNAWANTEKQVFAGRAERKSVFFSSCGH